MSPSAQSSVGALIQTDALTFVSSCHAARAEKAKALFPRPAAGLLRPVVRAQTLKYNTKTRLGRGFTLEELKVGAVHSRGGSRLQRRSPAMVQRLQSKHGERVSHHGACI